MAQAQTVSKDLYDLLVTRDFDPESTDEQGQASQPQDASVFSFDYVSSTGRNYGTAVIVLTDDHELQFFFGDNLGKGMEEPDKSEWFEFLRQLSLFSSRNNFYTFSPKNLNQLKHTMAGMAAIKEGLFEGYYGTRRVSYMGEETEARLMIRHRRPLGETDARHRNIDSLFIETAEGERFRLPFTYLAGGRAMLEHVRQGGRPYDVRGVHITEMVSELKVLSRFRRANQGRVAEGVTQSLIESADQYYQTLREDIARLAHQRGYDQYFESWTPLESTGAESLVEDIKQLFVEQTIDARIEAALPILARIKENNMREADIFESWADRLTEGTWALPETPEQQNRLKELMSKEMPLGPDATNATQQLYDLVGDDQLYDIMQQAAQGDPDANVWDLPEVRTRMEELGVSMGELPQGTVGTQAPEGPQAPVSEADNLATFVEGQCNHTMEGESCPVHGLAECGMHESLRDREHHVATVTLDDGTVKKVRITSDEGYRDMIHQYFARQGRRVKNIDVDFAVRADEDSTDPMDRRGGVWDSFYESKETNAMAQAVTRRIVNQHPEWITRYGVEFLMQVIDDVTEGEEDWEEIGSSDVSAYVNMVHDQLQSRGGDRPEMADRPPFTPGPSSDRDQFGNVIKHRARHLARQGMRKAQGVREGHADQQRKIVKQNGRPVGEVGIDRESSPGVGQYYMKHYASGTDNSGYDSREEALADLRHVMKQSGYGELREQGISESESDRTYYRVGQHLLRTQGNLHQATEDEILVAAGRALADMDFSDVQIRSIVRDPDFQSDVIEFVRKGRRFAETAAESQDPLIRLKNLALAKTR